MKYIDLVIVAMDGEKILCQAPNFSYLKKGDKVMAGDHTLEVVASDSFQENEKDKTVRMILDTFDLATLQDVPKLKAKVKIENFIYNEEEGGETDE